MAIYHTVEQRSREWFVLRCSCPTASEFHRIVTPTGKLSAQAKDYAYRLLAEGMLGRPIDDDVNTAYMQRGQEHEDAAILAYEFDRSVETSPPGFITNDAGTYGCSPDRLIGDDGDLEMKIPAANTHMGYLIDPVSLAADKRPQVQGRLMIHGRKWVDLMSWHPELPSVIVRVLPDDGYVATLRAALDTFAEQLALMRKVLEDKYGPFPDPRAVLTPAEPQGDFDVNADDIQAMIERGIVIPQERQ